MAFINVFLAGHSWRGVLAGLPDFSSFYTAARIMHEGNASHLYNAQLQEAVQTSFAAPAVTQRNAILPYNHPPFEAWLFAPLGRFSFLTAYLIWLAFNLGLLLSVILLLRRHLEQLGRESIYTWLLACFAFYPIVIALLQGQDSILLLLCYTIVFVSLSRDDGFRAGTGLGLGLFKFQLVLPFFIPFLLLRRSRVILGFSLAAVMLGFAGLLAVGWRGFIGYPAFVTQTEQVVWGGMPNLRGLVSVLLPRVLAHWNSGVLAICSAALLAALTYAWSKALAGSGACRTLVFALSLVAAVLLSYHLYLHDLSVLFLASLLVFEVASSCQRTWLQSSLYTCLVLLFCSPIYIALSLRNHQQLQVLAGILLLFFIFLLKAAAVEARDFRHPP